MNLSDGTKFTKKLVIFNKFDKRNKRSRKLCEKTKSQLENNKSEKMSQSEIVELIQKATSADNERPPMDTIEKICKLANKDELQ